jgi:hypothetical protein
MLTTPFGFFQRQKKDSVMKTNRREFMTIAGAAGVGRIGMQQAGGDAQAAAATPSQKDIRKLPFVTELFLDNERLESNPGVSRKLHQPKKHLLNPVVRSERWCEGNIIQPYTTMYDKEDKLFKMWARSGSDWNSAFLGGNAAYMLYFTSTDGVRWDKPDLGVAEIGGRRDHNIVYVSDMVPQFVNKLGGMKYVVPTKPMVPQGKKAFFWSVVKNPKPRDASEKFVALAIVQDHRRGAHIVSSPDGIHWSCADAPF